MKRFLLLALIAAGCNVNDAAPDGAPAEHSSARSRWELRLLRDPVTGRIPENIHRDERVFAERLDAELKNDRSLSSAAWLFDEVRSSPVGGRTRAFGIDVRDGNTIIAGGVSGGMWYSTDRGGTWTRATHPDSFPASSCLVQDTRPGHEDTWYIGTGEIVGGSPSAPGAYYQGDGLMRSTDNGRSWHRLTSTSSNTPHTFDRITDFVWNVAVDRSNDDSNEVYAAIYGGIIRSVDGGTTWQNSLVNTNRYSAYTDIAVTDSGDAYATMSREGNSHGIWRSIGGGPWRRITPRFWPAEVNRTVIGITPSNPNIVYFLAHTPGTGHLGFDFRKDSVWASLWRYNAAEPDTALRWTDLSANLPSFGGSFGDYNPQSSYNMHIEVDPRDSDLVYIGGTNLYRSTDGFRSGANTRWIGGYQPVQIDSNVLQRFEYPNHHPDQHLLLFDRANPDIIYTASDGGVHRADLSGWKNSPDSFVQWEPLNRGYETGQFYTVDIAPFNGRRIIGGLQDNGTWMTADIRSDAWFQVGSGDGSWCTFVDETTGPFVMEMYVSKQQGRIYRVLMNSSDSVTGSTRVDPFGPGRDDYDFINPYVVDSAGERMYLPIGRTLWRNDSLRSIPLASTAPATTGWRTLDSIRDPRGGLFSALSLKKPWFGRQSDVLWLGTDSGSVLRIDHPGAAVPVVNVVTDSAMPRRANINCIWIDPEDSNRVVVVFSNYSVQSLWLTENNGATWTPIGGNLEANAQGTGAGPSCRWFESLEFRGYIVGTSTGLYQTGMLDGMNTVWERVELDGVRHVPVVMMDVGGYDLAVATHGNGMYYGIHYSMGVNDRHVTSNAGSVRIAPNPVHDRSTVELIFAGSSERTASIEIADASGRIVHRRSVPLADGRGSLTLDVAGLDLPAGRYLFTARAGARHASGSVTVVR